MTHVFHRHTKNKLPVAARGDGVYVVDQDGNRYLDASGGAAVSSLGHSDPDVRDAIAAQLDQLAYAHTGFFTTDVMEELAATLCDRAPGNFGNVYFVSGGSEGIETALKIARQYFLEVGQPERRHFIARRQSYHGNTLGALSVGGNQWRREPFDPILMPATHIAPCYPYRDRQDDESEAAYGERVADELDAAIQSLGPDSVAAFVAETVVGATAGAVAPVPGYFKRIREICDAHDVMFIADEVVTGFGRTGRMFGLDHWNVAPDFLCIGKGMSGGYAPLAATIVHEKVFEAIAGGSGVAPIGFSYGGNPVSCAAGLAALDYIEAHDLVTRAARMGEHFGAALEELRDHPLVGDVRGIGLLRGVEIVSDKPTKTPFFRALRAAETISAHAMAAGGWILPGYGAAPEGQGDWLGLAPPFVISEKEIGQLVAAVRTALDRFAEESRAAA